MQSALFLPGSKKEMETMNYCLEQMKYRIQEKEEKMYRKQGKEEKKKLKLKPDKIEIQFVLRKVSLIPNK